MGYQDELSGDRGLLRGENDYDELDELASLDVDYLEEMGAVMAPDTTSASRCPSGEEYDRIEQMCRPVPTSTGTARTRLRARLQTTAPTLTKMVPTLVKTSISTSHPVDQVATVAPVDLLSAGVSTRPPPQPSLPSSTSKWKGGSIKPALYQQKIAKAALPELLVMPEPPPPSVVSPGGRVVGLSTGAKIGLGLGAGALLVYLITRK